ncbi:hypothetical protein [uncultured Sneathia sp.]|nr:hypothetical protein [uncultured Sneathia sp.]
MKKQNKKELTEYEKQILKLQNEIIDVSKKLFKIYCDREKKDKLLKK